jgi:hypothetical protein
VAEAIDNCTFGDTPERFCNILMHNRSQQNGSPQIVELLINLSAVFGGWLCSPFADM